MTVVDRFVQAVSHGGAMKKPTLIVIHSAETPLKAGYAKSIAENWFGKSATTSAHFMVDPVEIIRMLSDNVVSYAVGPKANGFTLNIEQAGYARFSRAEWTTPDGMKQMGKVGALIRELCVTRGIPLRYATDAQIRAAATGTPGGICFHDDIRRVLGGTSHVDPMPNYPRDLLLSAPLEDDMFTDDDRKALIAIHDVLTPGVEGVKFDGDIITRLKTLQATAQTASDAVTPGIAGVKFDGATYGAAKNAAGGVAELLGRAAESLDPGSVAAAIVAAIPADMAQQVADELAARLAS